MITRRQFLGTGVAVGTVGLTGCSESSSGESEDGTDSGGDLDPESDLGTWRMAQHDAANTRHAQDETGPTDGISKQWSRDDDGDGYSKRVHQYVEPVVVDGRIISVGERAVYAVSAADGEELWHNEIVEESEERRNDHILTTPAVADGTAIIPTRDKTVAVSVENGTVLWEADVSDGHATIADSTVYVSNQDITALSLSDGSEQWQTESVNKHTFYDNPAVSEDTLLTKDGSTLYGLDTETGEKLWKTETGGYYGIESEIAVAKGTAYGVTDDPVVKGFDIAAGEQVWAHEMEYDRGGERVSPGVAEGNVVVVAENAVLAFDAENGRKQWEFEDFNGTGLLARTSLSIADGVVYVSGRTDDRIDYLLALSLASGSELWRYEYDDGGPMNLVPVDGRLIVNGKEGLYSFSESA